MVKVIANLKYLDKQLNRHVEKGEVIEVDEERAKVLTENKYNGIFFCSPVEEKKKPAKKKSTKDVE